MQHESLFLTYTRAEASDLLAFSESFSRIHGSDHIIEGLKIINELSIHRIHYPDLWAKYFNLEPEIGFQIPGDVISVIYDRGGVKCYIQDYLHESNANGTESKAMGDDVVSKPAHYNNYEMETIEAIKGQSTSDEFSGFLKGNIIKYIARYKFKNGVEDLEKAKFYLSVLIGITQGDSLPDIITDLEAKEWN